MWFMLQYSKVVLLVHLSSGGDEGRQPSATNLYKLYHSHSVCSLLFNINPSLAPGAKGRDCPKGLVCHVASKKLGASGVCVKPPKPF